MDAAQALTELTEISSQIEAACLFGSNGTEIASTLSDEAAAGRFLEAARALLAEAESVPRDADAGPLAQLEAATPEGSVLVVRDGELAVAAVTKPEPTVGLVFYDLKSCLRALTAEGEDDGRPRPRARKREESASESAA
jgi:predicted regulator of Ras-like GTPase activity (Roadblock/LC7/MglB family)